MILETEESGAAALVVRGVSKTYGATRALRDVTLTIERGEMHALAGGNGSGKSTLVKILAGVVSSDAGGRIAVGGTEVDADRITPHVARSAGLHFVHQDPGLFDAMTVADNLCIGHGYETSGGVHISRRRVNRKAAALISRFELGVEPGTLVGDLSAGKRATIAIARALQDQDEKHSGLLVLDEPTASLPAKEVEELLGTLRRFADAGQTVLYISHRLDEMCGVADRVSVLRDGEYVGTFSGATLTERELIAHIAGRPINDVYPSIEQSSHTTAVLEVSGLVAGRLRDVSLTVHEGEIVGVCGLLGSGRSTLLRTIFGDLRASAGEVRLDGTPLPNRTPRAAMAAGVGYVPEDRASHAIFPNLTVQENITAASIPEFWKRGRMNAAAERAEAMRLIDEFGIKAESGEQLLSALSGGNQQKVVFARWLRHGPRLLLLDEPTQGIDVGARADIYQMVRQTVKRGAAVLVVASDTEELAKVCDRVLILRDGRIADEVLGPGIDPDRLTELSYAKLEEE